VGTRIEVAFDPRAPRDPVVPGAAVLADLEATSGAAAFSAALAGALLISGAWQLLSRVRALRRSPARTAEARRVRVQRGLITRSWLELDSGQWLPVHFVPELVTLPSPTAVTVHGDPARSSYLAVTVPAPGGAVRIPPSGRVRRTEPAGRRTDNPRSPDPDRLAALGSFGWRRQLHADLAPLVMAPALGGVWALGVGTGAVGWLAATALAATTALHIAALRGSDPS
jgi:hypothetical protein